MATKETIRQQKYNPKSKRAVGVKLTKDDKLKIIDKIQDSYLRTGTINKLELSRELKISRSTIISMINDMHIEMESLPKIQLELKLLFERIKNRLIFLWDKLIEIGEIDGKYQIRSELAIIKEMKDTMQNFYSLLQEFGDAPKQADKVDVRAVVINADIDIEKVSKELLG